MKTNYERADDEVERIENDESLSDDQKRRAIRDIRDELREYEISETEDIH